ncbi:hypothetical protein BX616_009292, partial [Lobosporangium transversale]
NPINNNLCSKCFKELSQKNGALQVDNNNTATAASSSTVLSEKPTQSSTPTVAATPAPTSATTPTSTTPVASSGPATPLPSTPTPEIARISTPTPESGASTPTSIASETMEGLAPGERPPQVNKGRCYLCRAK